MDAVVQILSGIASNLGQVVGMFGAGSVVSVVSVVCCC